MSITVWNREYQVACFCGDERDGEAKGMGAKGTAAGVGEVLLCPGNASDGLTANKS